MAKDTGTSQEYWKDVRDCAASAVSNENWSQDVALADRVHELVDQSQWVIYTGRNLRVLEHTAHFDAYEDDERVRNEGRTEVSSSQSISAILTVAAYYAMQADVHAEIARLLDKRVRQALSEDD